MDTPNITHPIVRDLEADMAMIRSATFYQLLEISSHRPDLRIQVKKEHARRRRNAQRRAENDVLRELCGTSARAAREDMGLGRR